MWSYNIHFVFYIWFRTAVRRWSLFMPVFLNTQRTRHLLRLWCFKESGEIEIKWNSQVAFLSISSVYTSIGFYHKTDMSWIQYMALNHSCPKSEQHVKFSPPISTSYQEKMLWELMKWSPGKMLWSLIKFSIKFLKEKYGEQFFSSHNLRRYLVLFSK